MLFIGNPAVIGSIASISKDVNGSAWLADISQNKNARVSLRFITMKMDGERKYFIAISIRTSEQNIKTDNENYLKIVYTIRALLERHSKSWDQDMQDIFDLISDYIFDVNGSVIDLK